MIMHTTLYTTLLVAIASLEGGLQPKKAYPNATGCNGTIEVSLTEQDGSIRPFIDIQTNFYTNRNVIPTETSNLRYQASLTSPVEDELLEISIDYRGVASDEITGYFEFYFDSEEQAIYFNDNFSSHCSYEGGVYDDGVVNNGYNGRYYSIECDWAWDSNNSVREGASFTLTLNLPELETYQINKNLNNCHGSGNADYELPDTFNKNNIANPYEYMVIADEGYYFPKNKSAIQVSEGVIVFAVDYGDSQVQHAIYTDRLIITLTLPLKDVSITITASPITIELLNSNYDKGFTDAKAIYGDNVQFAWIKQTFNGMADFFSIQVFPNITLGFLCFAPLVVVAIVAIVRIIKHE